LIPMAVKLTRLMNMKKLVLSFLMLLASSGVLRADPVTFEATVNSPRVSLDEVLQLTLTFTGINQDLDPVSLPVLNGFTAKYLGPSTSVSIINGDYHSERSFIYNLFPNKVGRFQIPPITATVAGQTYTSKPIDVEVFESSAQAQGPPPSGAAPQNQAPTAESLKDKVLIIVSVDRTEVYLNERVPLSIKLLVNAVPIRDIQYPQFDKTGFTVDEYDKPGQDSEVFNGVKYDVVEFKTNIYPSQLGDVSLGPVQIQGNVVYKVGQENNPFGADIFNNFFDSYATSPMTVSSQPIHLHVSALPVENRPDDFSGAVGQSFDFQASVAPVQVKVGDPLTLKMDIKGSGNFKGFQMPVFKADGFKTYEPQIKNTGDEKTAEEVIIPTATGIKQVPALRFSYFDTSARDYRTITQGPFPVQVTAPNPDQEFKAIGFADVSHAPLAPVNTEFLGKAYKALIKLFHSPWFWAVAGIFLAAGVSYLLWRRFQDRLSNDPAFARRLKAVREARQALALAEGHISKVDPKEFYGLVSKVLRDYLANKWHQSSAALSIGEIISGLRSSKADETHIAKVRAVLEQADLVCFAGAAVDPNKMRADLSDVHGLIAYFEKLL